MITNEEWEFWGRVISKQLEDFTREDQTRFDEIQAKVWNHFQAELPGGNTLDVGEYDPLTDTIVIEGTKYTGSVFRPEGFGFQKHVGQVLRIVERNKGGAVHVTRLPQYEGLD